MCRNIKINFFAEIIIYLNPVKVNYNIKIIFILKIIIHIFPMMFTVSGSSPRNNDVITHAFNNANKYADKIEKVTYEIEVVVLKWQ